MKLVTLLPSAAIALAGLTWVLLASSQQLSAKPSMRIVRMTKTASQVAGDEEVGRGWWEEQRFAEYALVRGLDLHLKVKTTIGDYLQKYVASAVAGESPDTIHLQPEDVAFWNDHGLLEPLNDYVASWDAYRNGHINEAVLDLCRSSTGEILCITDQRHGPEMYAVRSDWLQRLGLKAPTTWHEAYEVWKAFTYDDPDGNGADDTYGFCFDMRTSRALQQHIRSIEPFLLAAGVRWFERNAEGQMRPAFNVPGAVDTLEFIKRCYKEGLFGKDVMYRADDLQPLFQFLSKKGGGMSAYIYPNFYKPLALEYGVYDKVELIPFLWKDEQFRQAGRYATSTFLSGPRCILKTSDDKQGAWEFLEYWFSNESLSEGYSKRGNARESYIGRFGIHSPAAPWIPLRNDIPITAKLDPWIEKLARPVDAYVVQRPYVASWSQIAGVVAEAFVDFYLDRFSTAQAALDEAEKRSLKIIDAYEQDLQRRIKRNSGR